MDAKDRAELRKTAESFDGFMPVDKTTIIALLNALDSAEKTPRCPCGGRFEGVGYHKGDTVYQCEKCGLQISVTKAALTQKGGE